MKFLYAAADFSIRFLHVVDAPDGAPKGVKEETPQAKLDRLLREEAKNSGIEEPLDDELVAVINKEAEELVNAGVTPEQLAQYLAEVELDEKDEFAELSDKVAAMMSEPIPKEVAERMYNIPPQDFLKDLPQEGGLDADGKPVVSRLDTVTDPRISPANLTVGSDVRFSFMYENADGKPEFNEPLWRKTTAGAVLPKKISAVTDKDGTVFTRRGSGEFFNEDNQRLFIHGNDKHGFTEIKVASTHTPGALAKREKNATDVATKTLTAAGIEVGGENYDRLLAATKMAALKEVDVELALALAKSEVFSAITDKAEFEAAFESALIHAHRLQDGLSGNVLKAINSGDRTNQSVNYFLSFLDTYLDTEERKDLLVALGFEEKVVKQAEMAYDGGLELIGGDLMAALKAEVARGEGNYESYNRGRAGDSPGKHSPPLTTMTFGEVMRLQSLPRGSSNRLFAVGKYQLIPATMREAVRYVGIKPGDRFSPENQERLFAYLISAAKRPKLNAYITGRSKDLGSAHRDLAREFASIPGPDGRGMYDGDRAGNAAAGGIARARKVASILSSMHKKSVGAAVG